MTVKDFSIGAVFEAKAATIAPFASLTATALANIGRIYETLTPSLESLGVLFALDAAQTAPTEQWVTYFVETASAQLIWDERPTGSVSEVNATWVLARFDEAPTLATMAVLVRLVEEAQVVPTWFGAEVRNRAKLFGSVLGLNVAPEPKRVPYLRLVA
jgi:hypothetical protein